MECRRIEEKLSAYIDKQLSSEDKVLVDEHLKACTKCSLVLEELKQTISYTRKLEDVDPPAWLEQKIMAKVREEADEKKGIVQKLFFPRGMKIPLQAAATLAICVVGFFVFKSIKPELNHIQSPQNKQVISEQESDEEGDDREIRSTLLKDEPEEPAKAATPARPEQKHIEIAEEEATLKKLEVPSEVIAKSAAIQSMRVPQDKEHPEKSERPATSEHERPNVPSDTFEASVDEQLKIMREQGSYAKAPPSGAKEKSRAFESSGYGTAGLPATRPGLQYADREKPVNGENEQESFLSEIVEFRDPGKAYKSYEVLFKGLDTGELFCDEFRQDHGLFQFITRTYNEFKSEHPDFKSIDMRERTKALSLPRLEIIAEKPRQSSCSLYGLSRNVISWRIVNHKNKTLQ